jgi:hypothetical protein
MIHAQRGIDTILWNWTAITDGEEKTANLDCGSASHASVRVLIGAEEGTDATATVLSLLASADTEVTNFATVTANLAPDALTTHMVRYEVDCKARGRYLRLSFTAGTGTGSNQSTLAIATLYGHAQGPATAAGLSASTSDTVVIV